jgi:CMP-N,N'-diacetyllegionaminic acid synthase
MNVVCIILARGGSKGIPNKNIIDFCGKPLIGWSILQASACEAIAKVWVSSDSDEILTIAKKFGANCIKRPTELSADNSSSESGWEHAIKTIKILTGERIDYVVAPQATSPIRQSSDFTKAIAQILHSNHDSLLTATEVEDYFSWTLNKDLKAMSINYDYKNRQPRQNIKKSYLENGSFYIFKPQVLAQNKNRLGGEISIYVMQKHKMFQIDAPEDIQLCEVVMRGYGLNKI